MAEILGLGLSHYPPFSGSDDDMANILRWTMDDPAIPKPELDPRHWNERMRQEWGDDRGVAAAATHREKLVSAFTKARAALDAFEPDAVVVWGDDQYENFREDVIPPYAVLVYPDKDVQPWRQAQESADMTGKPNAWNEPADTTFTIKGRPDIAKYLVSALLEDGIDVAYAYEPLHHPGMPHAFLNAVLYLDYERRGFPYPVIPFPVNCYGRRVISYRGYLSRMDDQRELDPPSPSPARMFEVGAATARALRASPWRIAVIASSSWSHAFTCDKTWRLHPDTEADQRLYDALAAGDFDAWRGTPLSAIDESGQHELLNWFPLLGAMSEVGRPKPTWSQFVPTEIFNSNKVFAIYEA